MFFLYKLRDDLPWAKTGMRILIAVWLLWVLSIPVKDYLHSFDAADQRRKDDADMAAQIAAIKEPDVVDLGLPSGTLWADRNIGATAPESGGLTYAFGTVLSRNVYPKNVADTLNRDRNICGTCNDIATCALGAEWQLPCPEQLIELMECCKARPTDKGYELTGPNGNRLFLPYTARLSRSPEKKEGYYRCGRKQFMLHFESADSVLRWCDNEEKAAESMSVRAVRKYIN